MGEKGEGSGGRRGGKWGRRGREVGGKGEGTGNGIPPCPPPHEISYKLCCFAFLDKLSHGLLTAIDANQRHIYYLDERPVGESTRFS